MYFYLWKENQESRRLDRVVVTFHQIPEQQRKGQMSGLTVKHSYHKAEVSYALKWP